MSERVVQIFVDISWQTHVQPGSSNKRRPAKLADQPGSTAKMFTRLNKLPFIVLYSSVVWTKTRQGHAHGNAGGWWHVEKEQPKKEGPLFDRPHAEHNADLPRTMKLDARCDSMQGQR